LARETNRAPKMTPRTRRRNARQRGSAKESGAQERIHESLSLGVPRGPDLKRLLWIGISESVKEGEFPGCARGFIEKGKTIGEKRIRVRGPVSSEGNGESCGDAAGSAGERKMTKYGDGKRPAFRDRSGLRRQVAWEDSGLPQQRTSIGHEGKKIPRKLEKWGNPLMKKTHKKQNKTVKCPRRRTRRTGGFAIKKKIKGPRGRQCRSSVRL